MIIENEIAHFESVLLAQSLCQLVLRAGSLRVLRGRAQWSSVWQAGANFWNQQSYQQGGPGCEGSRASATSLPWRFLRLEGLGHNVGDNSAGETEQSGLLQGGAAGRESSMELQRQRRSALQPGRSHAGFLSGVETPEQRRIPNILLSSL